MAAGAAAAIRIAVAGWSVPARYAGHFPGAGSHLERYGATFDAVEINSSFYRPHRPETYRRWADATPDAFRFAVKTPRAITHERRLIDVDDLLDRFLSETAALGAKRGPLLVQSPPSLAFREETAERFFRALRDHGDGPVACEPRHASWFTPEADALLAAFRVARAAADPAPAPGADRPGGWRALSYHRLHGSPRMYHSPYGPERLAALAAGIVAEAALGAEVWCVLDNTAAFAATEDALALRALLRERQAPHAR